MINPADGKGSHGGSHSALVTCADQVRAPPWLVEPKLPNLAGARAQAMARMLPTLRLTAAGLDEHLGGLSLAGGLAASRDAADFDAAISDIKVSSSWRRKARNTHADLIPALRFKRHAKFTA